MVSQRDEVIVDVLLNDSYLILPYLLVYYNITFNFLLSV